LDGLIKGSIRVEILILANRLKGSNVCSKALLGSLMRVHPVQRAALAII
jgi:hypothetical protein